MKSEESVPRKIGHYLLERRLGAGGMGEVFLAHDERLDRPVAVKRLRPDVSGPRLRARFRREGRAAARLSHPAIARVYEALVDESREWIVMEYVAGRTLRSLLQDGVLDLALALRLGREIAEGLAEAHARDIVHRDLKCENVLVTPRGHAKIVDFGLAKRPGVPEDELTGPYGMVGTFRAMSPEQARGEEVSPRSDLFSLGTLLYEVLSGVHPFAAPSAPETLRNISREPHAPLEAMRPQLPADLARLVDHLLQKEPEARPRSAREVARDLAAVADRLAERSTATIIIPTTLHTSAPTRSPASGSSAEPAGGRPGHASARRRIKRPIFYRIAASVAFLALAPVAVSTLVLDAARTPTAAQTLRPSAEWMHWKHDFPLVDGLSERMLAMCYNGRTLFRSSDDGTHRPQVLLHLGWCHSVVARGSEPRRAVEHYRIAIAAGNLILSGSV